MRIQATLLIIIAALLAACGTPARQNATVPTAATAATAVPAPTRAATTSASKFHESPFLYAQVQSGSLPPVDQRLPERPARVTPASETGSYGGSMRFGFVGTSPGWGGLWYVVGWENLVGWKADFSEVQPNIAERWETSPDARTYTFTLRKGMRWSDGAPFTADDIMFYLDDVLLDPDLGTTGVVADWLPPNQAGDFKATKVDDYTVRMTFPQPYGTFLYTLATWSGRYMTYFPKHYLKQFHKKYNPAVDQLVARAGDPQVTTWVELFNKKAGGPNTDIQPSWLDPARPVLHPWVVTKPLDESGEIKLVRNPYYWKVDDAGNQLPYIDAITGISFPDNESRVLALLDGELDAIKDPGTSQIYLDAVEQGAPLQLNTSFSDGGNVNSISFNQTVDDPIKAEIFASKDFRIGMSHAINRQAIIDTIFGGQGEPAQVAPLESSPLYNERLATQYTAFDRDLANAYLDKVLPERDASGLRLDKTGQRLSITLQVISDASFGQHWVQLAEQLVEDWAAVGVGVKLYTITEEEFSQLRATNQLEATIYTGEGGAGLTAIFDPRYYVPMDGQALYGPGWAGWRFHNDQATAVLPQQVRDLRALYEDVLATPGGEEQNAKMRALLEKSADAFWVLGIARPGPVVQPFHKRMHNIPQTWTDGWINGVLKVTYPEQWYIKE